MTKNFRPVKVRARNATQEDLSHTEGTRTGQGEKMGFKRSYKPAKMSRMNDCLAAKVMRYNPDNRKRGSQCNENLTPPKLGLPRVLHGYITIIIT